jgi:hypothetical protein
MWLRQSGRSAAWYQVDSGDADPVSFFHHLSLMARQAAGVTRLVLPQLHPRQMQGIVDFARNYFEVLFGNLAAPFTLVFDNYHEVGAPHAPGTARSTGGIDSAAAPTSASLPRRVRAALAAAHVSHGLRGAGDHRREQRRQCRCPHRGNRHYVRRTHRCTREHTGPPPGRIPVGAVAGTDLRGAAAGVSALWR